MERTNKLKYIQVGPDHDPQLIGVGQEGEIAWVSDNIPHADMSDDMRDANWSKEPTGWSSSYYEIPEGSTELQDLIEHKQMSFSVGNIFKAAYRMNDKGGAAYNLRKILWFCTRELRRIENEHKPGSTSSD